MHSLHADKHTYVHLRNRNTHLALVVEVKVVVHDIGDLAELELLLKAATHHLACETNPSSVPQHTHSRPW